MLIRCQQCKALFSLQDSVAGRAGSFQVECGRCKAVFVAEPPERLKTPPPMQDPVMPAPFAPGPLSSEHALPTAEIEKALRPRSRSKWPLALAGVFAVIPLALVVRNRMLAPVRAAQARLAQGREILLRDDLHSIEQATKLFTEAARLAPGDADAEAQRAFALLLQAASHKDLAARLEPAVRGMMNRSPDESVKLAVLHDAHQHDFKRRLQEGLAAAKAALEDDRENPVAQRALLLHAALDGSPAAEDRRSKEVSNPPENGDRLMNDAWGEWTKAAIALSGAPSREAQDRALQALALARQAEPRMLRARVDTAAISVDRQEAGPARALLTQVLAENPAHERAQQLLSQLPSAP